MLRSKVPAKHSATDRPNPSKSDSFQFGEGCSKESGKATPEETAIPLEKQIGSRKSEENKLC
jgi:hypothetical protein